MAPYQPGVQRCVCGQVTTGERCVHCGRPVKPVRGVLNAQAELALRTLVASLDIMIHDLTELRLKCHQAGIGYLGLKVVLEQLGVTAERLHLQLKGKV